MRQRTKSSTEQLKARADHDVRRRIANDFARFVRKHQKEGLPFYERELRAECWICGHRGRLFVEVTFRLSVPGRGQICNSDPWCAICAIQALRQRV